MVVGVGRRGGAEDEDDVDVDDGVADVAAWRCMASRPCWISASCWMFCVPVQSHTQRTLKFRFLWILLSLFAVALVPTTVVAPPQMNCAVVVWESLHKVFPTFNFGGEVQFWIGLGLGWDWVWIGFGLGLDWVWIGFGWINVTRTSHQPYGKPDRTR